MAEHFITLAIQTRSRAERIFQSINEKGIECRLEKSEFLDSGSEEQLKIRVKLDDLEKALAVTKEIDKKFGAEVIDVPIEDISIKKILIPVIFKDYSLNGAYYTLQIADKLGATIHLIHTYFNPFNNPVTYTEDLSTSGYFDTNVQNIEKETSQKMKNLTEDLKAECKDHGYGNLSIEYTLTGGNLLQQLKSKIIEDSPDLLVLGTRGKDKKSDDLMGTFSSKVIKELNVPVLTIPEGAEVLSWDPVNILYITKFDNTDFTALHRLISLMAPFNPKVHVAHIEDEEDSGIKREISKIKDYFSSNYENVKIEIERIHGKEKISSLQETITKNNIDLISINIHKTRFFNKLFSKRLDERILFHTNIPVMVFHF